MSSAFEVRLHAPFDEAVERVTEALREQGFGVLTRIDLAASFKEKLGVEFHDYVILGACNPRLAHRALSARPDVGLLLPCNVTLEESGDAVLVRIIDPEMMMASGTIGDDATVAEVASEARGLLERVAASLKKAG